ncbi:MAG: DNA-directed RNA polymerase subunit beta [Candidatus Liptonbacteria bacterium]|nr:DNA-directed RNA polymerase subunit beta [Candidatus Liptonbacteria bacterium]
MPKLPVRIFSSHPGQRIEQPNLFEIQQNSYRWFTNEGLKELFDEISPIADFTGKELELHVREFYFDAPKYDEELSQYKDVTYEAPLRATVELINRKTGAAKKQEVYLGDFPIMTERGTFIIIGVERVVVSQLVRSAGVYMSAALWHGKKLFGAKVIPNRGTWLEFATDPDGFIGVKIDRRRKVSVVDLLRTFESRDGLSGQGKSRFLSEDDVRNAFADVDTGPIKFLDATLKKTTAKTHQESYMELYKRIRPGDLATAENAKSLIDAMFNRFDRYDLSEVGRYKLNQRLEKGQKETNRLLVTDDIIRIVREIVQLNNTPTAEPDDIDHLGNRRVRAVGELLQNKLRVGLMRMRRIAQDRMAMSEVDIVGPAQLVNARPLSAAIREFFSSSQMSQFMDQINPLAAIEHKRLLSAMGPGGLIRERAGFEVRDVHRSHYGRICPIQTPEGANIGLVSHLANFTRLNKYGFLETPYAVVKNGTITKEIVWLNALDEEKFKIAHGGVAYDGDTIRDDVVEARIHGDPGTCLRSEVDLIDVAPNQFISVATSLIPFLNHDDANRALMGSNMQRQAVVPVRPDAPYVRTGVEEKAAADSGHVVYATQAGEVTDVDARHIVIKEKEKKHEYPLAAFKRSNQFSSISHRPLVKRGQKVKKGDLIADGPAIDNGVLALGQNLFAAFVSWEGANYEDAIILSERVVENDYFSSLHIEDFVCDVRDTKLGPEVTTPDIPNVSEDKLKNLDEEGIIRIGAEVRAGDILVGKITPKGETELTSEERLLRAIIGEKARDIKDTSLTLKHGKFGRVVGVKIFSRERGDKLEPGVIKRIQVEIAQLRKVRVGDKLAGRHGNKGVISQIRPVEDMPHMENGTPVDIILNPLGVASRMNLGQILEMHLGWAARTMGFAAATPSFSGATEEQIRAELKKAGLPESGAVKLIDGRTGEAFDRPVAVGTVYIMKLNHLVEDKIHMRSIGPYSLITQQPLGGKAQFGGQRFGEMEVWALEAFGAAHILQEMLTYKSDDIMGRAAAFESIVRGEEIRTPNIPASFNVLVNELKALGFNIELNSNHGVPITEEARLEEMERVRREKEERRDDEEKNIEMEHAWQKSPQSS